MKKLISILTILCLLPLCVSAKTFLEDTPVYEDFYYKIVQDEKTGSEYASIINITEEGSKKEIIEIPDSIEGRPVKGIQRIGWATYLEFNKYEVRSTKKVILPDTVRRLSTDAFFSGGKLESINLDNIEWFEHSSLRNCVNLKNIGFRNRITAATIEASAFENCGLETVFIDNESMRTYKNSGKEGQITRCLSAFKDCAELKFAYFGEQFREMGKTHFRGCKKLDNICFGPNMSYVQYKAFADCDNLRTAMFFADNIRFENLWAYEEFGEHMKYFNTISPEGCVFENCPKLTIIGKKGTVEAYAKENNIPFIPAIINHGEQSTVVTQAQQTATVTINGVNIPAYTVNGSVYVGESALRSLGFNTAWDGEARTTAVTAPENVEWSVQLDTNPNPYPINVVSSDVSFWHKGFRIPALNVGNGESIIDVNALAERVLY